MSTPTNSSRAPAVPAADVETGIGNAVAGFSEDPPEMLGVEDRREQVVEDKIGKIITCIVRTVPVIIVLMDLCYIVQFNATIAVTWLDALLGSFALLMPLLLCALFFSPLYTRVQVDDVTAGSSSSTPTPDDPAADVETGHSPAGDSKDTAEKHEVEEKRKPVFVDEGTVKILNRIMDAILVIGVLMLLYCWVNIVAKLARTWLEALLGGLGVVLFSLIFAFFVMHVRRDNLDVAATLDTRSSSVPATSDLTTNLLPPASEN